MSNDLKARPRPGKHVITFLMALFLLTLGIGIGTLINDHASAKGPGDSQLRIQTDGKPVVGQAVLSLSQAFEEVAGRVVPAVVNINTEEVIDMRRRGGVRPGGQDPMQDLFRQFFGGQGGQGFPERQVVQSLGSGVLVDPKGYIITNRHVVEGANKIKVNTSGNEEYIAKVIASDELSDLAVIKIDGKKDFPFAKVGDSKAMKIGDWVLAIGSPFGLEHTVTAGIVSATGRMFDRNADANYSAMLFNDYLQTDAAINQGNSGGPLVNMNGEVVGINSFISTQSRSSAGVGFAVPSHTFVNVYNQILTSGRMTRGWLGVSMNSLPSGRNFTPEMAKFFGVKQGGGVLITGLINENGAPSETGPAAKAGIKPEDVIVEFGSRKIFDVPDLRLAVANTPPGQKVPVKIVRYGEEKTLELTVVERTLESSAQQQKKGAYSFEEQEEQPKAEIGIQFDTVPPRMAQEFGISGGAILTSVKPGSLADDADLAPQDIVVAANGKKISNSQELLKVVKEDTKSGEPIVLKFVRGAPDPAGKITTSTLYTSILKP